MSIVNMYCSETEKFYPAPQQYEKYSSPLKPLSSVGKETCSPLGMSVFPKLI